MKKLLLIFLLFPLFAGARIELRPYVTGGYFNDMLRKTKTTYVINPYITEVLDDTKAKGWYADIGLNAALPVSHLAVLLGAGYEQYDLSFTYTQKIAYPVPGYPSGRVSHFTSSRSAGYIGLAPAVTYGKLSPRGFNYLAECNFARRLALDKQTTGYSTLGLAFSAGYRGALLRLAYDYGITGVFKSGFQAKSSRINIGLTIYPVLLLKG